MAEVSGQRIVNFVESTSPNNQDYFATDNANNGNRKVSYVTLSDKVLDKLSTKTFSLDGSNKTVLDALAELFQADDTLNARIDNIITPSGQPSMTELADIRTNFLGITYGSAGEAVRQSDMIASGLKSLPFSVYDGSILVPEVTTYKTISIDTQDYRGSADLIAIVNTKEIFTTASGSEINLESIGNMFYGSNVVTPSENDSTLLTYYDYIPIIINKAYCITQVDSSYTRASFIFSIPENFPYRYLQIVCFYDEDAPTQVLPLPPYEVYGASRQRISFADPNNDGNIVIS